MTAADTAGPRLYTSNEACQLAQVTYRQLNYWLEQGVIVPTLIDGRGGMGSKHRWNARSLRVLRIVGALAELGANQRTLRLVPEILEHHAGEAWLMAGPERVRLATEEELVEALTNDEPTWLVIRVASLLRGMPSDERVEV